MPASCAAFSRRTSISLDRILFSSTSNNQRCSQAWFAVVASHANKVLYFFHRSSCIAKSKKIVYNVFRKCAFTSAELYLVHSIAHMHTCAVPTVYYLQATSFAAMWLKNILHVINLHKPESKKVRFRFRNFGLVFLFLFDLFFYQ